MMINMSDRDQPNILFIMDDQHHAKFMGCAGHPFVKTPNLDSLAKEGVRFENAFCQTGLCVPSRVSFLTGQYTHTHGVYGNTPGIPETLLSIGNYLQQHGYQTFASGKLHLPGWKNHGFGRTVASGMSPNSDYSKHLRQLGLEDRMDRYGLPTPDNPRFPSYSVVCSASRLPAEHSMASFEASEMIRFIEERDPSKPFFGWLTFDHPHEPFPVPEPYVSMYKPEDISLPSFKKSWWDKIPPEQKEWAVTRGFDAFTELELKTCVAFYCGLISLVDWNIGRVLRRLGELGLEKNTIVIFTSDHGDFAGERGWINKAFSYDAILRIPMLWKFPGKIADGETRNQMVESVDLFPTLCDLAGLPIPMEYPTRQPFPKTPIPQGTSLLPILSSGGDSAPGKNAVFSEWIFSKTIRTERHKLTIPSLSFTQPSGAPYTGELYDLKADPFEWNNLYNHEKYVKIRSELTGRLLQFLMDMERPRNAYIQLISAKDHINWWKTAIDLAGNYHPTVAESDVALYKKARW